MEKVFEGGEGALKPEVVKAANNMAMMEKVLDFIESCESRRRLREIKTLCEAREITMAIRWVTDND